MKFGFAFVDFIGDTKAAIRALDGKELGKERRRIKIDYSKPDTKYLNSIERNKNNPKSQTLFVVGFDPVHENKNDLLKMFEKFGTVTHMAFVRGYCYVKFTNTDDAEKALTQINGVTSDGAEIRVEYSYKDVFTRFNIIIILLLLLCILLLLYHSLSFSGLE